MPTNQDRSLSDDQFKQLRSDFQSALHILNKIVNPPATESEPRPRHSVGSAPHIIQHANNGLRVLNSLVPHHVIPPTIHVTVSVLKRIYEYTDNCIKIITGTRLADDEVMDAHHIFKRILNELSILIEGHKIAEDKSERYQDKKRHDRSPSPSSHSKSTSHKGHKR